MSDSEDFNSAKDEEFDEPAAGAKDESTESSDDEPLSKGKKAVGKKSKGASKTKTPQKNGKSPKKAGRPPGKAGRKSITKAVACGPGKDGKRGRGRPSASAAKTKKAEKPAKVSFSSGDPLALSDVEDDPLNNDDEEEEEEEYEVKLIYH